MSRPVSSARQPTAADWAFLLVLVVLGLGTLLGGFVMLLNQ